MKKIFLLLAAAVITFGAAAQVNFDKDGLRYWRQTHQMRDASRLHLDSPIKQAPATKSEAKYTGMPADTFWFPGEWEEVQAIVVTPYYAYYPTQGNYQVADPVVPGYAYYYQSYYSRTPSGIGPYGAMMDTADASGIGDVAFYLMDAIQLGGAQAWVRVEQLSDSAIVKRKLARMGLRNDNMRFIEGPGNSFWYRDCGPICFYYGEGDTVGMLDFEYYPGRALDDSLPVYINRQMGLPNFTTSIEWEGGNCLVDGTNMVISSDAIYEHNRDTYGQITWDGVNTSTINYQNKPSLTNARVKDSLRALIGPRATYILPAFQYDGGTGHIDLYADMIDENQFIFSKMPDNYSSWVDYQTGKKNMDSLCSYESYFGENYWASYIPFPSRDNGGNFSSQTQYDQQYTRTYSNHTFVNNVIIQPCFSAVGSDGLPTAEWDKANIIKLQHAYPGYTIYCVDVRGFDGSGGAIHCITKQIPAEHPIRILHPAYHDSVSTVWLSQSAPIYAEISNVDGIAEAKIMYRIDGGDWLSSNLNPDPNDNSYNGVLPTTFGHVGTRFDYYITATSNAGKTITKPMTAAQGGYYSFCIGGHLGIEEANTEERFGQFFPNPASDRASMIIDLADGADYSVSIIDLSGRTIHTSTLKAAGQVVYHIDASRLAAGQYTVVFQNGSERVVRKLIVK